MAEAVGSGANAELNIVGKQRSRGVEFDLNGQLTDQLSVAANYTYTKVEILRKWKIPWRGESAAFRRTEASSLFIFSL